MNIVVLDTEVVNPGDLSLDAFNKYGDAIFYPRILQSEVKDAVKDAEVIITNKTILNRDIMQECDNLKYIGLLSTGYNTIDIDYANERGILVTNVPNYSTDAVAQHTFALILSFYSDVKDYSFKVKSGCWSKSKDFCMHGKSLLELKDKVIGIFGFGNIGKKVSLIANAFGMNVIVYSRTKRKEFDKFNIKFIDNIDDLFRQSDILSVHCPLSNDTRGLIDIDKISLMKKESIIINTSRGPIINEKDLIYALKSGIIAGAGLDVVSVEPIKSDNELLKLDNCIITPHVAWLPKETRERLIKGALDNLDNYINKTPINVINK